MTIKTANDLFKNKHYEEALEYYNVLMKKMPELSSILLNNIILCRAKINSISKKKSIIIKNKKNLFEKDCIHSIQEKKLPELSDITLMIKSTEGNFVNKAVLDATLKCCLSSPFQKKLLRYTRKILVQMKLKQELNDTAIGFNIGTMIKLATDKSFWLEYRIYMKNIFFEIYEIEPQFANLIDYFDNEKKLMNKFSVAKRYEKKVINEISPEKSIAFGTILLNEEKFILKSLYNHYHICDKWVLVEGTCLGYPTRKVTKQGFSKDNTKNTIELFPDPFKKLKYIKYGWTKCGGEDAKSELRNEYLKYITEDFLIVLDADEFYFKEDLINAFDKFNSNDIFAITLPQVHFWKNTSQYITGDYYDISHTRLYRNISGMRYIRNHNFPEINGQLVHEMGHSKFKRTQTKNGDGFYFEEPTCYHMGFAKDYDDMQDKSEYYINRGESTTRVSTTKSRAAWFNDDLPENCKVKKWSGKVSDVLIGDD